MHSNRMRTDRGSDDLIGRGRGSVQGVSAPQADTPCEQRDTRENITF